MKKQLINLSALLGLLLASTTLSAEVKYGPVLKIKPKGFTAQPAQSKPAAPRNVNNNQSPQPIGLLLPAVQKAR